MKHSCNDKDGYVNCYADKEIAILEYMGRKIADVKFCPFCGEHLIDRDDMFSQAEADLFDELLRQLKQQREIKWYQCNGKT